MAITRSHLRADGMRKVVTSIAIDRQKLVISILPQQTTRSKSIRIQDSSISILFLRLHLLLLYLQNDPSRINSRTFSERCSDGGEMANAM